jgi:hypothetical protein
MRRTKSTDRSTQNHHDTNHSSHGEAMTTTKTNGHAHHSTTDLDTTRTKGPTIMKTKKTKIEAAPIPTPTPAPPPAAPPTIDVPTILASLAAIVTALGPSATPLTIAQRRKLAKMRAGGETLAGAVMSAADRYGLILPGVDSTAVSANVALVQSLAPVKERLAAVTTLVSDVEREASSSLWRSTLSAYKTLARFVPEYPNLQQELAPIASFLAVRFKEAPTSLRQQERRALAAQRAKRKAKKGTAPSPPTTNAPAPNPAPVAKPAPSTPPTTTPSS